MGAHQRPLDGISIAFSTRYIGNYSGPLEFLPGYFSCLFLHQNGAVTPPDELGSTKGGAKEAAGVVSRSAAATETILTRAEVKRRQLGSAFASLDKADGGDRRCEHSTVTSCCVFGRHSCARHRLRFGLASTG